jgi:hypothetical protein
MAVEYAICHINAKAPVLWVGASVHTKWTYNLYIIGWASIGDGDPLP